LASVNRLGPSVEAPYGIPLKVRIPPLITPRSRPREVSTIAF
jgi:hypothetical protein